MIQQLEEFLEDHNFTIKKSSDRQIQLDHCIIVLDSDNNVHISFDANIRPDYSAFIVSLLHEYCNKVVVGELYTFDENGEIVIGDKALSNFKIQIENSIIDSYLEECKQQEILETFEPEKEH